jgi:acetyl-CoA carboxylase biotin carboxyl carrier protein
LKEGGMTGINFDAEAIRALADILVETGLTEIEISEKDSRVRVVRAPAPVAATPMVTVPMPAPVAAAPAAAPEPLMAPKDHPGAVLSPMVGVAYLAPEPGASPFVALGQTVTAGQTLLLIEAMKTFNQIKAPVGGRVTQILVQPGSPVEYGEPLMVIEA